MRKVKVYPTSNGSLHYPGEPSRLVPYEGAVVAITGYWEYMRGEKRCRIEAEDHVREPKKAKGDPKDRNPIAGLTDDDNLGVEASLKSDSKMVTRGRRK